MLSDVDIDKLIAPFEARELALEEYVIGIIAKRVKEIGKLSRSDLHRLERLYAMGADVRTINKAIAKMTGLQEKDIQRLIYNVAQDAYIDVEPYYNYRKLPYIPFSENVPLQAIVNSIAVQTQKEFRNLSNTKMLGFVIRDFRNPKKKKFYNVDQTYKTVIDEAIQAAQSGVLDYNTVMRRTLKQLNDSGLRRVYYESGYSQRMSAAVRRNILDGIKEITQRVTLWLGEKFDSDGVELTAHRFPAPDHAPFQGHQFKKKQFERLQNNKSFRDTKWRKFPAQKRIIGQWNCRHFAYPVILGVMDPTYTDEELQNILNENEKGITLPNGKHMTGYEATQKQNELARKVRQVKEEQMLAQQAGDEELAKQCQADVNRYTKEYNAFNKMANQQIQFEPRKDKLTVPGYKKISTK